MNKLEKTILGVTLVGALIACPVLDSYSKSNDKLKPCLEVSKFATAVGIGFLLDRNSRYRNIRKKVENNQELKQY